jgi:hypothetical protein
MGPGHGLGKPRRAGTRAPPRPLRRPVTPAETRGQQTGRTFKRSATGGSPNDHLAPEKAKQVQRVPQRRSEPPVFETRDIRLVDSRP